MLDVRFAGATLVDGTGAPARLADVGVRHGRVVAIRDPGALDEPAVQHVDATGLVLAPGFVDLHTHYDAQLCWDPTASPSPLHGVTTVLGGNCGFTIAPAGPDHADYLMRMLARVEGMPIEALSAGLAWDWNSFGDWLGGLEGSIAVNAGFLVGHSALRRVVMGDDAIGSPATPEQVAAMVALLRRSLNEGGLGLSTSQAGTHRDRDGNPVPSRAAGRDELLALAGVLADVPGMSVSLVPAGSLGQFSDDEVRLLTDLSLASRAAVNWNVLGVSAGNPAQHEHQLAASDHATAHGATVVALTLPHRMQMRLSLRSGFLFDSLPGWAEFIGLPVPERIAALGDPGVRRRLDAGARSDEAGLLRALADWGRFAIVETFDPANAGLEGRTLRDVAAERGGDPFDVLCDVVVADDLRTGLDPRFMVDQPGDAEARAAVWADPRTVIGGSDAGAHLDMMCGAVATTSLLAEGVRDHQVISLEEAVRQLTDVPARLYGLDGRGQVREGWHADLVLFDPDTVAPGPVRTRDDLPGGAARLYAESEGIQSVWVNGSAIVRDGAFTGSTPGTVLRSGGT